MNLFTTIVEPNVAQPCEAQVRAHLKNLPGCCAVEMPPTLRQFAFTKKRQTLVAHAATDMIVAHRAQAIAPGREASAGRQPPFHTPWRHKPRNPRGRNQQTGCVVVWGTPQNGWCSSWFPFEKTKKKTLTKGDTQLIPICIQISRSRV